ncbi:XRE family transcriptional regulator [Corynebacterium heidelbergense]|uniref:XRE family transcriptional regulator n=2 Tax=Corynebacterium heidelbergense TaxID=2055947 RepID=A0A364V5L0_9CORY|nr:XRE family transcriptional regulator [Corynebacterium heidelbergense]
MAVMPQSADHLSAAQLRLQEQRRMMLGRVVESLRRERGMTQSQLAQAVGISTRGVIRLESGATSPTLDVFCRFADAFSMRPSELLRRAEALSARPRD